MNWGAVRALRKGSAFTAHEARPESKLHKVLAHMEAGMRERGAAAAVHLMDQSQPAIFEYFRAHLDSPVVAQAVTLKVLNLWLARHHKLARSTRLGSRPFLFYIDPSNSCNLACPGCVHSKNLKERNLFDWKPGLLAPGRLESLLKTYGPFAVYGAFYNYGDPLVNPQTPKFIRLAKSYLLQTGASTNLSFPKFDAEAYADSGLDYLMLSIDGATQPVYQKFRKKGNLDLVLRNIAKLVEAKRKRNRRTPLLSWNFLAFEHNVHEIDAARSLARELGVDQFAVLNPFDVSWDDPAVRPAGVEPSSDELILGSAEAMHANFNPFPEELDAATIEREFNTSWAGRLVPVADGEESAAGHSCHYLYKSMTMDAGGRVLPCCCSPTPERDLIFSEQPEHAAVADHYNSEKYRQARSYFADPEGYRREAAAQHRQTDLYCVNCEWNQTNVNFGNKQLQGYLGRAGAGRAGLSRTSFDPASLDLLCDW
jgi:MoaA/NifB/PqqE/SkfB family radical SAM enzyme